MAGLEQLRNVLHVIRARLYPNYLEHGGKYIARAKTERTLDVAQVCAEAVTRTIVISRRVAPKQSMRGRAGRESPGFMNGILTATA